MRNVLIAFFVSFLCGIFLSYHSENIKNKGKITDAFNESPYDRMDYQDNMTNFTYVRWIQVDNVQKTCGEIKGSPFLTPVLACADYRNYFLFHVCSIYSSQKLTMWTLGHEMRHCFQGYFHSLVL